jgi:V/A-type H+-transporting ATPase subunit I
MQPPTLLQRHGARAFDPLVATYVTVPYADVDPTPVAGLAYVAMFGMMFGDVGHGLLLLVAAVLVRAGRIRRLATYRRAWPFLAGAGVAAVIFGFLYGEFFGPTGLIPVLWLSPMDEPVPLLVTAVGAGAVLLAGAYVLGTVNRLREGGWRYALYARTGVAGSLLFLALGVLAGGVYLGVDVLVAVGIGLGIVGLVLAFVGLLVAAGRGPAGVLQAVVELFDLVVRLGSNLVSFARLAAFGLTHAALGAVVWQGTTAVWGPGIAAVAAVALFAVGNAVALTLEALVAGIQALRLEYYELFSRVFDVEGRPFRPWKLPADDTMEVAV